MHRKEICPKFQSEGSSILVKTKTKAGPTVHLFNHEISKGFEEFLLFSKCSFHRVSRLKTHNEKWFGFSRIYTLEKSDDFQG